jgi:hypothetical protein
MIKTILNENLSFEYLLDVLFRESQNLLDSFNRSGPFVIIKSNLINMIDQEIRRTWWKLKY